MHVVGAVLVHAGHVSTQQPIAHLDAISDMLPRVAVLLEQQRGRSLRRIVVVVANLRLAILERPIPGRRGVKNR